MLSDPTPLNYGLSLSATGGVLTNFRRTKIGAYTATDGAFTTDQMARLWITPTFRATGPSTYKCRLEVDKNVAPVNGVQQSDDTLRVDVTLSGNLRSFGAADFTSAIAAVSVLLASNMARIISGES